jgi:hypothetical protein
VIEWEDGKKSRKTAPPRFQDASMHRVSGVHSLEETSECVGDIVVDVLIVSIVSGK